jgi:hypothetical protein
VAACKSDILPRLFCEFQEWDRGQKLLAVTVNMATGRPDGFALEYLSDLYYIRMFDIAITSTLTSEVHKI